jgi:tetratricopeptide (TPR) repeat protein
MFLQGNDCIAQTAAGYEKAGNKALAKGDYYNAAFYFEQALTSQPNDFNLLLKKAEAQRLGNDYTHAAATYTTIVSNDEKHYYPDAIFYLAEMKKLSGMYETAKVYYKLFASLDLDTNVYNGKKAKLEIVACDSAMVWAKQINKAVVSNLGSQINTIHADYGGQVIAGELFYSSNRFETVLHENRNQKYYIPKILSSKIRNNRYSNADVMAPPINVDTKIRNNVAISPDKKLMLICDCKPDTLLKYKCHLMVSYWADKKWTMPQSVIFNSFNEAYTYTQPSITTNGNKGYLVHFVSNMPGGYGKLDIWQTQMDLYGQLTTPVNLGSTINTFADEVSPFYAKTEEALYFSSEGHAGLGGLDIFRSDNITGTFKNPINIGIPFNSSCNDIYFTVNDNDTTGILTSNRKGSMHINAETCCYDLYAYKLTRLEKQKIKGEVQKTYGLITLDDGPVSTRDSVTRSVIENELEFSFPLRLYFDNDQPDPKTLKETTKADYSDLYKKYQLTTNTYKKNYIKGFPTSQKDGAALKLNQFFEDDLVDGFMRLEKMCNYILTLLQKNKTVTVTVRGMSSPLADSQYNYHLSQRRISCFINYLSKYNQGLLQDYISNDKLIIIKEAMGEIEVTKVSDDVGNKSQSVYSPEAALARKIEVTSLSYK